tara:strand:- start:1870 stop:2037 length:168 start_codon:yes stop_codon:yes gene_type:complete
MLNEYKLKHNLTTQAELLAEENKDLTIEDAIQVIADNKSMNDVEIVDATEDQNPS